MTLPPKRHKSHAKFGLFEAHRKFVRSHQCRAYKTVPRTPDLPPEVRLIEIICPDCDDGDFHTEIWFSAPGVEVSQDREPRGEDA